MSSGDTTTAADSSGVTRPWRGVSAAERVAERRRRLLDAGLELFGTRGVAGVGVGDVCAEAELTKRYFYESFASIDDLVDAVIGEAVDHLTALVFPLLVEHGARNLRPAIAALAEAVLADPRMVRLLVVETQSESLLHHRRSLVEGALETALSALWPDDGNARTAARRRVAVLAVAGAVGEVSVAWVEGRIDLPLDELVDLAFDAAASIDVAGFVAR